MDQLAVVAERCSPDPMQEPEKPIKGDRQVRTCVKVVKKPAKARGTAVKAMKAAQRNNVAKGKRARHSVLRGSKLKTSGGLTKKDLIKNKKVSKVRSESAKKQYDSGAGKWGAAVSAARKTLGITGFCAVGGASEQGQALYAQAKAMLR